MKCVFCGHEGIDEKSLFCTHCGREAILGNVCEECQIGLADSDRYCHQCGAPSLYERLHLIRDDD